MSRKQEPQQHAVEMPTPMHVSKFAELSQERPLPLWREFLQFVVEDKKWWMVPILLICGFLGVLVILGSTGIAPMIYASW